jgi:bacterioferritin-associated ferredoxin
MKPDDDVCYCYHVSMRKLVHFARRVRPEQPSRMTECLSAGTGCGWCIPFLTRIARDPDAFTLDSPQVEEYAEARRRYITTRQPRNQFDSASLPAGTSPPTRCEPEHNPHDGQGKPET